jgi:magnesium-transporting ATPase (P-type)
VVKQGDLEGLVIATGGNTFFGRTAKLVTGAGSVSHAQRAMFQIGNFLIVVALVLAMIMVGFDVWRDILIADSWRWADALNILEFVLILLVASIPVAMPAVFSITMALGELALSKQQAIVSKLSAIEEIAGVHILCSDKTGTLTKDQLTDCGTAVSGATDAARSAAALILTAPGRSVINDAIDEARRIFGRITSYTVYRVALTMDIMFLVVLSTILLGFKPLTAIMIVVLAIRDDAPIMAIAYDNTEVASKPIRWRVPRVLGVSACSACSRWSSRSGSCSSALRSWAGPRTRSSPSFSARSSCSRSCSCRSCWAVTSCFTAPGRPSGSSSRRCPACP